MGSEENNFVTSNVEQSNNINKIDVSFPEVVINNDNQSEQLTSNNTSIVNVMTDENNIIENNDDNEINLETLSLNINTDKKHNRKIKKPIIIVVSIIILIIFSIVGLCIYNYDSCDIEKLKDNVVLILVYDKYGNHISTGSGVYINNNTIYTNAHVAADADSIEVVLEDNTKVMVKGIQAYVEDMDIAILITEEVKGMKKLKINENAKIGSEVYAVGSPRGLKNTISDGILSREYDEDEYVMYQHTAPISPGSSGGALFNKRGELIGINCATYTNSQNINLAIKIGDFNNIYEDTKYDELTVVGTSSFFEIEELNTTNGKLVMREVCSVDLNCRATILNDDNQYYKKYKNIDKFIAIESVYVDEETYDDDWLRMAIFKVKDDNEILREEYKKFVDYIALETRDNFYKLEFKHYWSINKDYYYYIEYSDNIDITNLINYLNKTVGVNNG